MTSRNDASDDALEEQLFGHHDKADTKTIQLCRQVEEAISYALAGSTSPVLRDLYVVEVEPVRGAALLRVLISTDSQGQDHEHIERALTRARGYFRHEVARAIHRKRVPSLEFVIAPPATDDEDAWEDWPDE